MARMGGLPHSPYAHVPRVKVNYSSAVDFGCDQQFVEGWAPPDYLTKIHQKNMKSQTTNVSILEGLLPRSARTMPTTVNQGNDGKKCMTEKKIK